MTRVSDETWMDERDRQYIEAMPDSAEREAARCAVTTYRRPDRLNLGDPMPSLRLARLDGSGFADLAVSNGRPLVLFFGSYT